MEINHDNMERFNEDDYDEGSYDEEDRGESYDEGVREVDEYYEYEHKFDNFENNEGEEYYQEEGHYEGDDNFENNEGEEYYQEEGYYEGEEQYYEGGDYYEGDEGPYVGAGGEKAHHKGRMIPYQGNATNYMDGETNKDQANEERARGRRVLFSYLVLCCCCFLVVVIAIALFLLLGGKSDDSNLSTAASSIWEPSSSPAPKPTIGLDSTFEPTPTMSPTKYDDYLNGTLNQSESPALDDNTSDFSTTDSQNGRQTNPTAGEDDATDSPTSPGAPSSATANPPDSGGDAATTSPQGPATISSTANDADASANPPASPSAPTGEDSPTNSPAINPGPASSPTADKSTPSPNGPVTPSSSPTVIDAETTSPQSPVATPSPSTGGDDSTNSPKTSSATTPSPVAAENPTPKPVAPTQGPTPKPVAQSQASSPVVTPTKMPTRSPTESPTSSPVAPTKTPTRSPTESPTSSPVTPTKTPTPSPTESPTASPVAPSQSPTLSQSPTQAPTLDPEKIYFQVTADTSIVKGTARRMRAGSDSSSWGTSGVLRVASTEDSVSSVILLQFDLDESIIPPPEHDILVSSFNLHLQPIESTNPADITVYRFIGQNALGIESMVWDDFSSVLSSAGRIAPGSFSMGQIVEGKMFEADSKKGGTVKVSITDLLSPDGISVRQRRGLEASNTILLLLQIDPSNGPGEQEFQSREAGLIVAPVITHEYKFKVDSCSQEPCGPLATCYEYDDGSISCECDDFSKVGYLEMCPLESVNCQETKVLDLEILECVCPPDKQETDMEGFCYPAGSACLAGPCTGAGSICVDDSSGGYKCKCSDDSVVGAAQNCDFSTIKTCNPPYPCGAGAYCYEDFDYNGALTVGCGCNDDGRSVQFGENCV